MIGLKGADGNHNSYLLCLTYYTNSNYTIGSKTKSVHMSNNDSIDEETKRILAEVEPDAQSGSNDSKESTKKTITQKDGYDEYFTTETTNPDDAKEDEIWD